MLTGVDQSSAIRGLLGPTNTGKTHRAVEQMLQHSSGMIGLPLRLLAREVYDRVSARLGEGRVALVTGEEKRIPARPQYWVSTVEAMPIDREVDFVAVDEVQLMTHQQRGHVFTDRILHARGRKETWFLGSHTATALVQQLLPTAELTRHPRLSKLSAGQRTGLGGLPPRTAVIAFSAQEVYELADRLRRRRGGTAVVLGALSPRTRNAQVAMYQAGEVDFIVATDAIGMGLNMDVDHVAFASLHKFDGRRRRALAADEIAQIAGRAGRHLRNGTFGTVTPARMPPEIVDAVEMHAFPQQRRAVWRNSDLDVSSLDALEASLRRRPPRRCLVRIEHADDTAVLSLLAARDEVKMRARDPDGVALLWEVCQVPDFRKLMPEHHATLLADVFAQLRDRGQLVADWMEPRVSRLEVLEGQLEHLLMRMEAIRTWTYISHKSGWVADASDWQERTQRAEDALSTALHERLIERFVERRGRSSKSRSGGSTRRSRKRLARTPGASAQPLDEPRVADHHPFAQLRTLRARSSPIDVVEPEQWVEELVTASHREIETDPDGIVSFDGVAIAQLTKGRELLLPDIKITADRELGAGARMRIKRRLVAWSRDVVDELLAPLRGDVTGTLSAPARGLVYQLEQGLGALESHAAGAQISALSRSDRQMLNATGVRFGVRHVFVPALFTQSSLQVRRALCSGHAGGPLPDPDRAVVKANSQTSKPIYRAAGYASLQSRVARIDVIEQLLTTLQQLARAAPFRLPGALATELDCTPDDLEALCIALGYSLTESGFTPNKRRKRRSRRGHPR